MEECYKDWKFPNRSNDYLSNTYNITVKLQPFYDDFFVKGKPFDDEIKRSFSQLTAHCKVLFDLFCITSCNVAMKEIQDMDFRCHNMYYRLNKNMACSTDDFSSPRARGEYIRAWAEALSVLVNEKPNFKKINPPRKVNKFNTVQMTSYKQSLAHCASEWKNLERLIKKHCNLFVRTKEK